jgi:molybdenum cofactor guanylyltransferase
MFILPEQAMLKSELTGLVIAGGKSSRMGAEKGLVQFGGKPLILYPVQLLTQLCSNVIICANSDAYDFLGLPVVADLMPGGGPMAGIYSGLMAARTGYVLILSCDMPLIPADLLQHLIASHGEAKAAVAFHKGFAEPLCGIYSRELLDELKAHILGQKFKLITFLEEVNARQIEIDESLPFYTPDLFLNMNTQADLERGEMLLSKNKIL